MEEEDQIVDYAIALSEGAADPMEEVIDDARMDSVATFLATRTFTRYVQEEDVDDEEGDDRLLRYITNAIAAAYAIGVLDTHNPTQPDPETITVSGKKGTPIVFNFYVS